MFKEIEITPKRFRSLLGDTASYIQMGDDMLICRGLGNTDMRLLQYPFKINSYLAAYCLEGEVECVVNLTKYNLTKGMLLFVLPGNFIRVTDQRDPDMVAHTSKFTLINVASSFLSELGLDFYNIFMEAVTVLKDPCIMLNQEEESILTTYMNLVKRIVESHSNFDRKIVSSLIASVFYQFAGFLCKNGNEVIREGSNAPTRYKIMFERFMMLIRTHHAEERMVGFYADKLCLTPKYLSRVVKEVSGRTAPEWIDEFVALKAKHLLKYSSLSIKEIAAQLNFANQSFFFRFFKRVTGMTPTEYRSS